MASLDSKIVIEWGRRRADITLTQYSRVFFSPDETAIGTYPGYVLGLYPVQDDPGNAEAMFVCELANGQCIYCTIDKVCFNRTYDFMSNEDYEILVQYVWEARSNDKNSN